MTSDSFYIRDITERQRAHFARAQLAVILEDSDDAIASKTLEGIVTSWNPAATRLLGYEAADIIGRPTTIIIPPDLRSEETEILARLRRGQRTDHFETVRLAKDGRRIDICLTVSPVKDESGATIGAWEIARDITERKRAENMLRDADRRNDDFLGTLVHELRNPLAPIRAAAELLRHAEGLAPEARAAANIIERQVRQIIHLVDDLLEVSRITSGRGGLNREPVDLGKLIEAVIETYRTTTDTARQRVTFSLSDEPVYVSADRIRLAQVFSNLLQNAVRQTPPGGRIEVVLHNEDQQVVVSIRDGGIGILPEMLDHAFDLFAQFSRSYQRADAGVGIGLALAKALTELHSGHIEARSAGSGTGGEFLVHLPTIISKPSNEESAPGGRPMGSASRRVLIADDNHDAAVSLSLLLEALGHETRIAHNGIEAVEEAEIFRPEVVLLDIDMPKLDGYGAAREIASRPWAVSIRIVAVTGLGQDADRQRAREAGFHEHLVKPADPDTLQQIVLGRT